MPSTFSKARSSSRASNCASTPNWSGCATISRLWSGKYDRELTDVFAIQDEISRGIVNGLRLKLGRGRRRYETSADAYDVYLRARVLRK